MAVHTAGRFGILQKILLTTLCVSLIPLAIIWAIDNQGIRQLTGERVEQQLAAFSRNLATQVDDWVTMNQRMLLQNAALKDVVSMRADRQNPVLQTITRNYEWAYLAFTTDTSGNNIGRSDGKRTKYYGDRDYIKQVLAGKPFGKQVLIGKTSGKPALVLSAPIRDQRGGLSGVIAIAMTLSDLSRSITEARIGQSGFAFLLDEKGEVIAHQSKKFTRTRADFSRHPAFLALKQGQQQAIYQDESGNKVIASMQKTRDGWVVITQQNYDEAFAPVQAANLRAMVLLVATLLLVILVAVLLSKRLAEPIRNLTRAADQLSQGKLDITIEGLDRRDEIGDLARAVDRLGTSIKFAIQRLRKKAA